MANQVFAHWTRLLRSGFAAPSANDCTIFLSLRLRGPTPLCGSHLIDRCEPPLATALNAFYPAEGRRDKVWSCMVYTNGTN